MPFFTDAHWQLFGEPAVWCPPGRAALTLGDDDEALRTLAKALGAIADRSLASDEVAALGARLGRDHEVHHAAADALRPLGHLWSGKKVLHLGADTGVASRLLAETAAQVVAVEPQLARAQVCKARLGDVAQADVVCADFEQLPATPVFDVVVALGTIDTAKPADALAALAHARRFLRPDGLLLLGVHNALSPGAMAAHPSALPLVWGEQSVRAMCGRLGLGGVRAFAAFGCLAHTRLLLSEEGAAAEPHVLAPLLGELRRTPLALGPEIAAATLALPASLWPTIVRHGLALPLAPALLFVARAEPFGEGDDVLASPNDLAYGLFTDRPKALHKMSTLQAVGEHAEVIRRRLYPTMRPAFGLLTQRLDDEAVPPGELLTEHLRQHLDVPGWSAASIARCLRPWAQLVLRHRRSADDAPGEGDVVWGHLIDVGPNNTAMCSEGHIEAFALEWDLGQNVPTAWVLMRGVARALAGTSSVAEPAVGEPVAMGPLLARVLAQWGLPQSEAQLTALCERELRVFGQVSPTRPGTFGAPPIQPQQWLSQRLALRPRRTFV